MSDQSKQMPAEIGNFIFTWAQSPQHRDKGFRTGEEERVEARAARQQAATRGTPSPSPVLPQTEGTALGVLFLQRIPHLPLQENPWLSSGRFGWELIFQMEKKKTAKSSLKKVSLHHWPVSSNVSPGGPDPLAHFANKHPRNKIGLHAVRLGTCHSRCSAERRSRDSHSEAPSVPGQAGSRPRRGAATRVEAVLLLPRLWDTATTPHLLPLRQPPRYAPSPPHRRPPRAAPAPDSRVISPRSPGTVDLYRIKCGCLPLLSIPLSWSTGVTGQPGETSPTPLGLPCLFHRLGQEQSTTLFCQHQNPAQPLNAQINNL